MTLRTEACGWAEWMALAAVAAMLMLTTPALARAAATAGTPPPTGSHDEGPQNRERPQEREPQKPEPKGDEDDEAGDEPGPGFLAAARDRLAALGKRGLRFPVGSIVSGSGLAAGLELADPHFGQTAVGADGRAMWSYRGYQSYEVRIGRIDARRTTLSLGRADANVTSLFNDTTEKTPGLAIFADAAYRDYPRGHYYGPGEIDGEPPLTDFGVDGVSFDLAAQWQRTPALGYAARVGVLDLDVGAGSESDTPDVAAIYRGPAAPGLTLQPRYLTFGGALSLDHREPLGVPRSGWLVIGAFWQFVPLNDDAASVTRVVADARWFRTITDRSVLALRGIWATDLHTGDGRTPFYLQYSFGGSDMLRGFERQRFRGEGLVGGSAELRVRAFKLLEVAPFVDIGTVAARPGRLGAGPVHVSPGVGLRVRTDEHVFFRMDWALGSEGSRFSFAFSPAF